MGQHLRAMDRPCLDCGDGFMGICIWSSYLNGYIKYIQFIGYPLYFNNTVKINKETTTGEKLPLES
jgi:hypothetical protein